MTTTLIQVEPNPPGTVNPRGALTQTLTVTTTRTVTVHWTHPYHGVTHGYLTAKPSLASDWVTVTNRGTWFELAKHHAKVLGSPTCHGTEPYETLEAAKAEAAAWLASRA